MGKRSLSGIAGLALTFWGAGMSFAFPDIIVPPVYGWILMATGGVLLMGSAISWLLMLVRPLIDFENVKAWSVSVQLLGLQRGKLADGRPYGLLHVELINHSATQSRVLDIFVRLESPDAADPIHYAMTEGPPVTERRNEMVAAGVATWLTDSFIDVPITIPPNGRLWGYVELATSTSEAKYSILEVHLSEQRSGQRKTLMPEECYDALKQRAYRGRLGYPYPQAKMRRAGYRRTIRPKSEICRGY